MLSAETLHKITDPKLAALLSHQGVRNTGTTVVNLFGGPGTGKSTTAAGLFHHLKVRGAKAELVTEFAKDLTYEKGDLGNQLMILAEQERRLRRINGQVDFIITDSPLPTQLVYSQGIYAGPEMRALIWAIFGTYDNFNVFLRRVKPFQEYGRNQSEGEARGIDLQLGNLAIDWDMVVDADEAAPLAIMEQLGVRQ